MLIDKTLCSRIICSLLLVCLTQTAFAASSPVLEAELQEFIAAVSGTDSQAQKAIEKLEWAGLKDPRLFDIIAARLQDNYTDTDELAIEANAWLAKGLAYSGNPEYQTLLTSVANSEPSRKLHRHVANSLKRLPDYQRWNPIIARDNHLAKSQQDLDRMRSLNMLRAEVPELVRGGTRRVHQQHLTDAGMMEEINTLLLANYQQASGGVEIDALAWMCRTLAASGDSQYKATLTQVANDKSAPKKIRKYAKKSLRAFAKNS